MGPTTEDLDDTTSGLLRFIESAPTPFHAASTVVRTLRDAGFQELSPEERFSVETGGRYVLRIGDGGVIAINLGEDAIWETGAIILGAHSDSPALRLKEEGISWRNGYLVMPTSLYGSPIVATWIDRDLGVAGRVVTVDGRQVEIRLATTAVIPNLPIHLNRDVNSGLSYNAQDHLLAIASVDGEAEDGGASDLVKSLAAEAAGCAAEDLLEVELYLHDPGPGNRCGIGGALLIAPRIDNLAGCYANLRALLTGEFSRPTVLLINNHEEIGSLTGEGAQSDVLGRFIDRIVRALGGSAEDGEIAKARSLIVSNDAAHAYHPAYKEKFDPSYSPVLGGGPVLKMDGTYRYATTARTGARFTQACERAGVPMQRYTNRSDIKAGGTIGSIAWARTGIPAVDVGIPVLAMHSIRETASETDLSAMMAALVSLGS
jgi:aspartyl aminopeptidase